jgi:TATA-box binding protein (TBP) (component of TFIID and TFIIIB)
MKNPKVALLIFALHGKIVCTGAKQVYQAQKLIYHMIDIIRTRMYKEAKHNELKIQNLVASVRLGFEIDLDGFVKEYNNYASYAQDVFPGVIFRHPKLMQRSILIFKTGRMVITGCKSRQDPAESLHLLIPYLQGFVNLEGGTL